jgi:hypothetical protein
MGNSGSLPDSSFLGVQHVPNVVSLRTPSYRRHKPSGQAVVTLNGRDFYLGKYGSASSKEEYHRLLAEYLLRGQVKPAATSAQITVVEVMAAYLRHAKVYYRKGGEVTREYGLIVECCRAIKPLYGRSPAAEFGPLALVIVLDVLANQVVDVLLAEHEEVVEAFHLQRLDEPLDVGVDIGRHSNVTITSGYLHVAVEEDGVGALFG